MILLFLYFNTASICKPSNLFQNNLFFMKLMCFMKIFPSKQRNYKKDLPDVIEKFKGYQTLDASVHPVITRGKKAKDIQSDVSKIKDMLN